MGMPGQGEEEDRMTLLSDHYWESYLFFALALLVAVWLLARLILDWLSDQHQRTARLTHAEASYLVGYEAAPRPNVRRVY